MNVQLMETIENQDEQWWNNLQGKVNSTDSTTKTQVKNCKENKPKAVQ